MRDTLSRGARLVLSFTTDAGEYELCRCGGRLTRIGQMDVDVVAVLGCNVDVRVAERVCKGRCCVGTRDTRLRLHVAGDGA